MKLSGMLLTERDIEILRFINECGFCEIYQIDHKFNLSKPRNYQLLNRLVKNDFLVHERVFFHRPGIYRLTSKGAGFSNLPPLAKVPLTTYGHHLAVTDLSTKLLKQYPKACWLGERQLKFDKYFDGVGKQGHMADGMLVLPDGKQIAIEVELTMKGKYRLERILKFYATQFSIDEVWYFCPKNLLNKISQAVGSSMFIKVFDIEA